jgi:hypothetical protein
MQAQPQELSKEPQILEDDKIELIIEKIQLNKPINPFSHYMKEQASKMKSNGKTFNLKTDVKLLHEQYKKLSEEDRQKYEKMHENEKIQYQKDLEIVNHFIFKDVNDKVVSAPTAYRIFVNQRLQEEFSSNKTIREIKESARKDWAVLPIEKKKIYVEMKKENDQWFEKCKKIGKVTGMMVFIQKTFDKAKKESQIRPNIKDIASVWKGLNENEKQKFQEYAEEINKEKQKLKDLYELTRGIKPRKPCGAYKIFLQEMAGKKEIKNLKEGIEKWKKLTETEKDEYLKKAHKIQVIYRYKKLIYEKKIKKDYPKRPGNAFIHFLKENKGKNIPGKSLSEKNKFLRQKYDSLLPNEKKKYEDLANKAKKEYLQKVEDFKDRVYDLPVKPSNGFRLYIKKRIPELTKDNKNKKVTECISICSTEWKNPQIVNQTEYEKKAEEDHKRYARQIKEFNKFGYYLKNEVKNDKINTKNTPNPKINKSNKKFSQIKGKSQKKIRTQKSNKKEKSVKKK